MRNGLTQALPASSVRVSEVDLETTRAYRKAFNDYYRQIRRPGADLEANAHFAGLVGERASKKAA